MTVTEIKLPSVGDIIDGRYELGEMLGQGGMGSVHLGKHMKLGKKVAIKLLRPEFSLQPSFRDRFQREALVMSKINHPNAVSIIDYGMVNGCLYLVMECLNGYELRDALKEHKKGLPLDKVLAWGLSMLEVLIATHGHGIVHRDIKPENILIEPLPGGKERVVVLDFGLAFVEAEAGEETGRMTRAGTTAGTPQYLSPEQATGDMITPASDIYSLGCVLYEMCTGSPPFSAFTVLDLLNKHVYSAPKELRSKARRDDLPVMLEHVVMSMLRKEPPERPTADKAAKSFQMLINELPLGLEAHRRGATGVQSREDRMISPANVGTLPTAPEIPVPRQAPASSAPTIQPYTNTYRVAVVGEELDDDVLYVLRIQSVTCAPMVSEAQSFDAIYAPDASAAEVEALCRIGFPVVSAAAAGDMARLQVLMQAGVAEVVTLPLDAKDMARKLQRAIKKGRRQRH